MSSLSYLSRIRISCLSVMRHIHQNPLIHPSARNTAICGSSFLYHHRRGYAFKSDLKIKWFRPTKIPCYMPEKTGDCETLPEIDMSRIPSIFQKSKEFNTADDDVKRLFSLQFLPKKWVRKEYEEMLIERVKRHEYDTTSYEVEIASMTARIRYLLAHVLEDKKTVGIRVTLKETIDRRKKLLTLLRKFDYKRFEFLLDKLNIIYKPHPKFYHRITRKESLTKLTKRHCLGIQQEKILAFKQKLESQKEAFLEEKAKSLDWIRNEELACGVEPSVTEDDIAAVQNKLQQLRLKKEKPVAEVIKIPYHPECLGL